MVAPSHNLAPARWKRAVGRFLTSRGFTHDEWQRTTLGVHHASLLAAVQQVLVQLRQQRFDLLRTLARADEQGIRGVDDQRRVPLPPARISA